MSHRVQLLRNGAEAYPRMLEAIAGARSFILLETYTFAEDGVGRQFARALVEKARAGVAVRVMYDAVGSKETSREFFGELRRAGCVVNEYNPMTRAFLGGVHGRRRNHRKLLVVDGTRAFAGGLNIAQEYTVWRDTAVEIEGPAVHDLGKMFLEIWQREEKKSPRIALPPAPAPCGPAVLQIQSSDVWKNRWRMARAYRQAIDAAQRRVWISNAYFVPARSFLTSLRRATRRGVDVRVLVPAKTDIVPVWYATRAFFSRLLRWGVRVFEWRGEMMHAKTIVIDGVTSGVGSFNIDHLSLVRNLELQVNIEDPGFGAAMARMFEEDLESCAEVDAKAWRRRPRTQKWAEWFFSLFRTFL